MIRRGKESVLVEESRIAFYRLKTLKHHSAGSKPARIGQIFEPENSKNFACRFFLCRREYAGTSPVPLNPIDYGAGSVQ